MKYCPKCGLSRIGEEFKCPKCDIFYSKLDEILFDQQQIKDRNSFKNRLKVIFNAENPKQAFNNEVKLAWQNTPLKTKISLLTIFAFVFALVFGI